MEVDWNLSSFDQNTTKSSLQCPFNVLGCRWQVGNGYPLPLCLVLDEIANNLLWLVVS